MKVEFYVEGAHTSAAFAAFLPLWNEARGKDYEASRLGASISVNSAGVVVETPEPEPAKRTRGKAKVTEPVAEAAPAIRATPEDRQPPAEIEEAEIVGDVFDDAPATVLTREDVKLALAAYAEKFGMAKAQAEGPKLMGAPRLSALPDDQEAFAKAIKALREAVANG